MAIVLALRCDVRVRPGKGLVFGGEGAAERICGCGEGHFARRACWMDGHWKEHRSRARSADCEWRV